MDRLYKKDQFTFAIFWIVFYVVVFSLANTLSSAIGTESIINAPASALMTAFLLNWVMKNHLQEKYGLCRMTLPLSKMLYFIPLIVISSVNLWNGVSLRFSITETLLYILSMFCVGFLEELIFRGFLFTALKEENLTRAILISSVTFGLGHIVNLLSGAEVFSTLLQLCYAVAIGFLFTIIFYKSKSLIPCIISHAVINALSVISVDSPLAKEIVIAGILTLVPLVYGFWIWKKN